MPSKLTVLKTSNTHSLVWMWDNTHSSPISGFLFDLLFDNRECVPT